MATETEFLKRSIWWCMTNKRCYTLSEVEALSLNLAGYKLFSITEENIFMCRILYSND